VVAKRSESGRDGPLPPFARFVFAQGSARRSRRFNLCPVWPGLSDLSQSAPSRENGENARSFVARLWETPRGKYVRKKKKKKKKKGKRRNKRRMRLRRSGGEGAANTKRGRIRGAAVTESVCVSTCTRRVVFRDDACSVS